MLKVHSFTFNPFQENTFIVYNENNDCLIVDPGCYESHEENALADFIEENNLNPKMILQTHNHLDHIFGTLFLQKKYSLDMVCHRDDLFTLDMAEASANMYGLRGFQMPEQPQQFVEHGEIIRLGEDELEVRFAPGHCKGHVVFVDHKDKFVLAGDCLFQGSIGRTDLPGGDYATLEQSIRTQLYSLDDDYKVYCGHGPSTSIGHEKQSNPFVRA